MPLDIGREIGHCRNHPEHLWVAEALRKIQDEARLQDIAIQKLRTAGAAAAVAPAKPVIQAIAAPAAPVTQTVVIAGPALTRAFELMLMGT